MKKTRKVAGKDTARPNIPAILVAFLESEYKQTSFFILLCLFCLIPITKKVCTYFLF